MLQAKALLITVLSLGISSLAYGDRDRDRDKNRDDDREIGCSISGHVVNEIQGQLEILANSTGLN